MKVGKDRRAISQSNMGDVCLSVSMLDQTTPDLASAMIPFCQRSTGTGTEARRTDSVTVQHAHPLR